MGMFPFAFWVIIMMWLFLVVSSQYVHTPGQEVNCGAS